MIPVSVVMPLRDGGRWLGECLDSIQAQSFGDFELLVVDDHSGDDGPQQVAERARRDGRIRLLANTGQGLVSALNHGLLAARGELVARMDADDRMDPLRLGEQAAVLREQPHTVLVASRVRAFPASSLGVGMGEYLRWQDTCSTPAEIASRIYVESPFVHPSVMFRRQAVVDLGGYRNGDFPEDYELWLRLVRAGQVMTKLPRTLLEWRQHSSSLSRTDPRYARHAFDALRVSCLRDDARLTGDRPLVVWGAGRRTRQRARLLHQAGVRYTAFVDIDPRKVGNTVEDRPVHPPQWLARPFGVGQRPFVLVYVASHGARESIAGALEVMGFQEGCDFLQVG